MGVGPVARRLLEQRWVGIAGVVAGYVLLAWWGERVSVASDVTLWYPPPGLAVPAVVLGGVAYVPAAIVAELLVSLLVFRVAGDFGPALTILNAVVVGGSYGTIGLVLRWLRLDPLLRSRREVWHFGAVLVSGAMVVALAGTTVQRIGGILAGSDQLEAARIWFQGDAVGMLCFAPAILIGVASQRHNGGGTRPIRPASMWLEAVAVVAVPIAGVALLGRSDVLFLSLFPVAIVALRRAQPGSSVAAAVVCGLIPTSLAIKGGAFDREDLEVLLATISATGLFLGQLVDERYASLRANTRLAAALARTDDMVALMSLAGIPRWWNRAAARVLEPDPNRPPLPVDRVLVGGRPLMNRIAAHVQAGETWESDETLCAPDGMQIPVSLVVIPDLDARGDMTGYTIFARDVSAKRAYEDELTRRALYDELTGIPNRALLRERLEGAVHRAGRQADLSALMLLDIDRFKVVNDSLGHAAGDELLQLIAERLQQRLRRTDTLARLGGDEFTVLVEQLPSASDAVSLAKEILATFTEPFTLSVAPVTTSASLGLVRVDPQLTAAELLRRADLAMYRAKSRGAGQLAVYDDEMSAVAARRLQVEATVRESLEAGSVPLHFQPVFDLATGEVVFGEALLRLRDVNLGPLPPGEVVQLAAETGTLDELGRRVVFAAAMAAAGWPGEVTVSVNVSPLQLRDGALVTTMAEALAATGLAANRLLIELTEEVFLDDPDATAGLLHRCHDLGMRVALDDFGSGWSSMASLRSLPIDLLKLDQTLLHGLDGSRRGHAVVEAVTAMAGALGIDVVAEGIETEDQREQALALGCRFGQGYLLAHPEPGDAFAVRLANDRATRDVDG